PGLKAPAAGADGAADPGRPRAGGAREEARRGDLARAARGGQGKRACPCQGAGASRPPGAPGARGAPAPSSASGRSESTASRTPDPPEPSGASAAPDGPQAAEAVASAGG